MNLLARIKAVFFPAYRVSLQGRAGIRYREGKKVMSIDSEILVGEFDMAVYLKSISCWLPPHERVPVSAEDRERIRRNLTEALKSMKVDWVHE